VLKLLTAVSLLAILSGLAAAQTQNHGVFEKTFTSHKAYADPFNEVDVDVIFSKGSENWRVPAFWRGGNQWTVRFAPPSSGNYTYYLESTDKNNPDLNSHQAQVSLAANPRGMLRVAANKRYFEYADGTPFYWLGDTWWTGLSDRLSWDGFQKLTANRKTKGFTVVQIVAGLVPSNEEEAPVDPGFRNEGGAVWDPDFKQINPKYFDSADRRIQLLVDAGIAPAIVGAWHQALGQMGIAKMEKHWRYIIARYAAYPVFWIVGGEVFDPPEEIGKKFPGIVLYGKLSDLRSPGWTEVTRYVRATDPYHHPVTVHEISPPFDVALQDESLTDFDLFQPSHMGWPSIALEVALLDICRSRLLVKPEVVGEIGYEGIGGTNLEDFQRVAFWLAMLNGAAGYTYGANPVFEAYSSDKPFQRTKYTLLTWDEGMDLPGAYQISLGAGLLTKQSWWQFEPHPEWVAPRGTTLLEPRKDRSSELGSFDSILTDPTPQPSGTEWSYPAGEWKAKGGTIFAPYAAGIPSKARVVYIPCLSLFCHAPPTVLDLEQGVRYHAYYWEPTLGVKFDLGSIERPMPGEKMEAGENPLTLISAKDLQASVEVPGDQGAALLLRYHDGGDYLAAVYSPSEKAIYLLDRQKGEDGRPLGSTPVPVLAPDAVLSAEARGPWAVVSITDGTHSYTSQIVAVSNVTPGGAGARPENNGSSTLLKDLTLRKSPTLIADEHLDKKLVDARGVYRGSLTGKYWDDFGKEKAILLDAYLPPPLPMPQDWVLVLETGK
jgi:hypothetical protein